MAAEQTSVSVFAPAPVLTVTIEPTDDAPEVHVHPGGQGLWIANMVAVLEARAILCAPLGGEIGLVLEGLLKQDGLELRGVACGGTNACEVEDRRSGELESLAVMPATRLNRHESDELCNLVLAAGLETGVAVLTGPAGTPTIDDDIYRRVANDLGQLGVTVVADLSGDPLEAALDGKVTVLKIADDEVDGDDAFKAAEKLRERAETVILTRGAEPALLFADEVCAIHVPELETVDHRGAGDSMTAGIATGLARGYDLMEAVQLGAAAGAVNVTRHGLASGRRDTIEKVAEQVTIEPATKKEVRRARADHQ